MSRANPIKGTIEPVPGMPTHVVIYRIPASSVWWTRCYTQEKRYLVRSTKTDSKREAQRFARQLFTDSLTKAVHTGNLNPKTIRAVAMSLLAQEKASAKQSLYTKDRNMVENTILPHFGNRFLGDITHQDLNEFLATLRVKNLSPATKKHYMGLLGKVFNHGIQLKVIAHRPLFPKLGEKLQTAREARLPHRWRVPDALQDDSRDGEARHRLSGNADHGGVQVARQFHDQFVHSSIRPSSVEAQACRATARQEQESALVGTEPSGNKDHCRSCSYDAELRLLLRRTHRISEEAIQ